MRSAKSDPEPEMAVRSMSEHVSFPPPSAPGGSAPDQGGYPAYPGYPGGMGDPQVPPPPAEPTTVTTAFWLMLVRAALSVGGIVVSLAYSSEIRAEAERRAQRFPTRTSIDVDQIVNVGIVVGVVVSAFFLVFYSFLAFKVRRGRQWARVVTWVLAGLGVLGLATQFLTTAPPASHIVSSVAGVVDLAVVVLLALRPTNTFFAAVSWRRRSGLTS